MGSVCGHRQQPLDQPHMGTAVRPAKTSPASWDAFADVDAFVDAVLAELMAGTRPTRSEPPLTGAALRKWRSGACASAACNGARLASCATSRSARSTPCSPPVRPVAPAAQPLDPCLAAGLRRHPRSQRCHHRQSLLSFGAELLWPQLRRRQESQGIDRGSPAIDDPSCGR